MSSQFSATKQKDGYAEGRNAVRGRQTYGPWERVASFGGSLDLWSSAEARTPFNTECAVPFP